MIKYEIAFEGEFLQDLEEALRLRNYVITRGSYARDPEDRTSSSEGFLRTRNHGHVDFTFKTERTLGGR